MMKIFSCLLVVLISLNSTTYASEVVHSGIVASRSATTETKPIPQGKQVAKRNSIIGPEFDDSISALPPNFFGNNIEAIYRSLLIPQRSEFETAAEYESRKQAAIKPATYAIVLPPPYAPYSADNERFDIKFFPSYSIYQRFKLVSRGGIVAKEETFAVGKYVGSNSYGVEVTVQKKQ